MAKFELLKSSPRLLIDTSYYIFYRFHATARWYSFKDSETPLHELTEDPVYVEAFFKHHEQNMKVLLKKYKIAPQNVIWCMDSPHDQLWRIPHHGEYKGTRNYSNFDARIFPLFYKYLKDGKKNQVVFSSLEADDVVALLCEKDPTHPTVIITNDNDYLQLCSPTTQVINMQGKNLALRGSGDPKKDVLIKILMGDKSDNIPPVFPKCGLKTAQQIACMTQEELNHYLQEKGALEQFQKNKTLISFDSIPNPIREKFHDSYQVIFK